MTDSPGDGHLKSVEMPAIIAPGRRPGLDQELTRLFRDNAAFVWRSLRRLGLDPAAAEDGVQEVFCVVHRRLPEFDDRGSLRAWLFAIVRRVAAHDRRARSRREARLRQVPEPAPGGSPEDVTARQEAAALVVAVLDRMDAPHRTVFSLAELEELTAPEIAAALEIPLNTVYSRLRNGRRKFARLVEELTRVEKGTDHER